MVAGLHVDLQEVRFEQMLPWAVECCLGDAIACAPESLGGSSEISVSWMQATRT